MSSRPAFAFAAATLLFLGCGGDGSDAPDATPDAAPDATPDAGPPFALTSTALAAGAAFAADNTCTGSNVSPELSWTAGPTGTLSYAVVLTDKSNDLVHWIIFDIPATPGAGATLPTNIAKSFEPSNVAGAHQTEAYDNTTRGYLGPCPPSQHTYEFEVHALDVAALPGASMSTTRGQAKALIDDHHLASATLTGTYAQP